MVFFNNYYEIYINNMIMDQPLDGPVARLELNGLNKTVKSFNGENLNTQVLSKKEAVPDFLGCSLNRVLVDDIRINFTSANRVPIVLTAGRAKMGVDADFIKFEQNINLNATQCRLSSQAAIWSNKYNGIFLPMPYTLNGKQHGAGGFFQITREGRCVRLRPAPVIAYLDMLDEVENGLLEYFPSMPNVLGF